MESQVINQQNGNVIDMTKAATLTHYHNQTTLICRADGSCWFGLSKYFVNHLRAKK